jgi:hypothetical protein
VRLFVVPFSFFLLAGAAPQPPSQPPALLVDAMKVEPGIRLLVPATDLREYSQPELEKFGYWPPWLVRDLDRDKRPDIAAVVVKPSPKGMEYGVVAVHARAPKELHWVMPLDTEPINGVTQGPAADTVVPLFCIECDSNTWFRFSGEEYEADLFAIGEKIDIGSETQADLPLYASANLASKTVTTVEHCTTVVVRKVGGTPEVRWYYVETPEGQRGWIPDTFTAADICIG